MTASGTANNTANRAATGTEISNVNENGKVAAKSFITSKRSYTHTIAVAVVAVSLALIVIGAYAGIYIYRNRKLKAAKKATELNEIMLADNAVTDPLATEKTALLWPAGESTAELTDL